MLNYQFLVILIVLCPQQKQADAEIPSLFYVRPSVRQTSVYQPTQERDTHVLFVIVYPVWGKNKLSPYCHNSVGGIFCIGKCLQLPSNLKEQSQIGGHCPLQVQGVKLLICLTPGFFYSVFHCHGGMGENAMAALLLQSATQGRLLVSFYILTQVLRSNP